MRRSAADDRGVSLEICRRSLCRIAAAIAFTYAVALTLVIVEAEVIASQRAQSAMTAAPLAVPQHVRIAFESAATSPNAPVPGIVEIIIVAHLRVADRLRGRLSCRADITTIRARGVERATRALVILALDRRMMDPRVREAVFQSGLREARFANGSVGLERASETMFGKSWSALTIDEAFALAGLAEYRRPDIEFARVRRNYLLEQAARRGFLSVDEAEHFKAAQMTLK
jgi:hypothetical protein